MGAPEASKGEGERRPAFAAEFPRAPELDDLVRAFEEGDYARVRREGTKLAAVGPDEAVRKAARELVARTGADKLAVLLFGITGALLLVLTVYWLLHNGPLPGAR